jgi:hypothetical protein
VIRICDHCSIDPPRLNFEPINLQNFEFNVDPDLAFPSNADLCGSMRIRIRNPALGPQRFCGLSSSIFSLPESLCLSFGPVGFDKELVADTIQVLLEGFVLKKDKIVKEYQKILQHPPPPPSHPTGHPPPQGSSGV